MRFFDLHSFAPGRPLRSRGVPARSGAARFPRGPGDPWKGARRAPGTGGPVAAGSGPRRGPLRCAAAAGRIGGDDRPAPNGAGPSPGRSDRIPGQEGSNMRKSLWAVAIAVCGASFSPRARRSRRATAGSAEAAIRDAGETFAAAANAKDAAKSRLCTRKTRCSCPQPGNDPGSRRHSGVLAGSHRRRSERLSLTTTHVAASGNVAYEAGTYQYTIAAPGAQPVMDRGKYVVGFRKEARTGNGAWPMTPSTATCRARPRRRPPITDPRN